MSTLMRLWRHLTRTRARVGWALTLIAVGFYGLYEESWPAAEPARQFFLVLASVAAGAIFLPELSSNLWSMQPHQVRQLIPGDRVRALQANLIKSELAEKDEAWAELIAEAALRPLIEVRRKRPHEVIDDLIYTAHIHPNETVAFRGTTRVAHRIEASIRGRRVLPPGVRQGVYWISVARDRTALMNEFREPGCLFREVVELDSDWSDDEWLAAVEEYCDARIVLGGATVEATTEPPHADVAPPSSRVLRWFFDPGKLATAKASGQRTTITVAMDYFVDSDTNRLLLLFASYYAVGTVQAVVRLYDKENRLDLNHEVFLGQALGSGYDSTYVEKEGLCKQLSIITSDRALIWPGSGVALWWGVKAAHGTKAELPAPAAGRAQIDPSSSSASPGGVSFEHADPIVTANGSSKAARLEPGNRQ